MKNRLLKIFLSLLTIGLLSFLLTTCDKPNDPDEDEKDDPIEDAIEIKGNIELPENVAPSDLKIISTTGTYDVKDDGTFNAGKNDMFKQFLFAENESSEIMLASLADTENETLSAESTAEVLIAVMPWTAFVDSTNLKSILIEISELEEFKNLTASIGESLNNGISPLNNEGVLNSYFSVFEKITSGNKNLFKTTELPEVDYKFEPIITYSKPNMLIQNAKNLSAAWGVEVLNKNSSVSGEVILPGGKFKISDVFTLFNFFGDNTEDDDIYPGEGYSLTIQNDGKYQIKFTGPLIDPYRANFSQKVLDYNWKAVYKYILRAYGINLEISDIIDDACFNENTYNISSELTKIFNDPNSKPIDFAADLTTLFADSYDTITDCLHTPEEYKAKFKKFLKIWKRFNGLGNAAKIFTHMTYLKGKNIDVCRQLIDGEIYTCFTLKKDEEIEKKEYQIGAEIKLNVSTEPDDPYSNLNIPPKGAKIYWKIDEGEGKLENEFTKINSESKTFVNYTPDSAGTHKIKAFVNEEDFVEYDIEVTEDSFNYELVIGEAHNDNISTLATLKKGDAITLFNFMIYPFGLVLDGNRVDVNPITYLDPHWHAKTVGEYPTSSENLRIQAHKFFLYDRTNKRDVEFTIDLTLDNSAYGKIVGNTITSQGVYHREWPVDTLLYDPVIKIEFLNDSDYKASFLDSGELIHSGNFKFLSSSTNLLKLCNTYTEEIGIKGMLELSGGSNSAPWSYGDYPKYFAISTKNSIVIGNNHDDCQDKSRYYILK